GEPSEVVEHAEYGARRHVPSDAHALPGSVHVLPAQHGLPTRPHAGAAVQVPAVQVPEVHALPAQHACPTAPHAAAPPPLGAQYGIMPGAATHDWPNGQLAPPPDASHAM